MTSRSRRAGRSSDDAPGATAEQPVPADTPAPGADLAKAPEDRGPGRYLRILTGVDEDMLAWVPTERARYTALGGVVLGTAVLAGFSMWNALSAVFGGNHWWLALPVIAWTLFVLNLDRWLVATSTGSRWQRRASVLVPRLIVAIFLGIIVAEPLVLKIFHTAIEQHIKDSRKQQLEDLRGKLVACNSLDSGVSEPTVQRPAHCGDYTITVGVTPSSVATQLASLRSDADQLKKQIDADTAELQRLRTLTQQECAGVSGAGLSGQLGEGPRCRRLERDADAYAASHPIAPNNERLAALRQQITDLEGQLRTGDESFEAQQTAEKNRRVGEMESHQGPIGFLERLAALTDLVNSNPFLFAATWLIRIFFILIDCLPVLVKFMTGATAYDRLVDHRINSTGRIYEKATRSVETAVIEELDVQQYRARAEGDMKRQTIDFEVREHTAKIEAEMEKAVQVLAERLRPRKPPRQRVSTEASQPGPEGIPVNGKGHQSMSTPNGAVEV